MVALDGRQHQKNICNNQSVGYSCARSNVTTYEEMKYRVLNNDGCLLLPLSVLLMLYVFNWFCASFSQWVQIDRLQWTLLRHRHVVTTKRTPQAVTLFGKSFRFSLAVKAQL